jgi:alpha-tubulin suppressor-like RCC1 family protein
MAAISAGGGTGLAVTSAGRVLAWGYNADGELGDGGTSDSSTPVRVDLPPGTQVTAIAVGGAFSLAVARPVRH